LTLTLYSWCVSLNQFLQSKNKLFYIKHTMSYMKKPSWERVTLPTVESVHIMKDPPKSIEGRKKERVGEADVMYMWRENPDLLSDYISYYAKGNNPMVSIQYGDYSKGAGALAKNPYRAPMGGNQYRMPLMRLEDRQPLSRLKHGDTTIRPSISAPGQPIQLAAKHIDKQTIKASIFPSAVFNVGKSDHAWTGNQILDPIHYTIDPKPASMDRLTLYNQNVPDNAIKDKPLSAYLTPIFNVAYRSDPTADVKALELPIKEKINIAMAADARAPIHLHLQGDQPIKLKDYTWSVVQTTPTSSTLLLEPLTPEVHLTPNLPQYSVTTNLSFQQYTQPEVLEPILDGRPIISAFATPNRPWLVNNVNRDVNLKPTMDRGGDFSTFGSDMSPADVIDITPQSAIDPYKAKLNRKVYEMAAERYGY